DDQFTARSAPWHHGAVQPVVHYARSDGVHIAYSVFGDGPIDVVVVPGFVSSVDLALEGPLAAVLERLARVARVITFDKRGTGMSDRAGDIPGLETRMDDLRAVMDANECNAAHLVGVSEGGPMAILFAATFPERALSLTLYGSTSVFVRTDDHPWMPTLEDSA